MWNERKSLFKGKSRRRFLTALVVVALFPWPMIGAPLTLQEADITFVESLSMFDALEAEGDFNGDGFNDIVVAQPVLIDPLYYAAFRVFFGKSDFGSSDVGSPESLQIILPTLVSGNTPLSIAVGDFNGDGKSDLALGAPYTTVDAPLFVVAGRASNPGVIDLRHETPDWTVVGKSSTRLGLSLATGDFNGDGLDDLLVSGYGVDEAYVIAGTKPLGGAVIDVAAGAPVITFRDAPGRAFPFPVAAGDVNGDGLADIILSAPNTAVEGNDGAGRTYVVWGNAHLPALWDLRVTSANVTIEGDDDQSRLSCLSAGDMDGDGRAELLFQTMREHLFFHGFTVSAATVPLNTRLGSPFVHVPMEDQYPVTAIGDFDGDGRKDIFSVEHLTPSDPPLSGHLTSDARNGWPPGGSFGSSFQIGSGPLLAHWISLSLGDVNGDGNDDLIIGGYPNLISVFLGYRPLTDPRLVAEPSGARAAVSLSVNGAPREMKLGGDILDSVRDQWIPYIAKRTVTLTPLPGQKKITAVFRNSFKRESDEVQTTLTLTPGPAGAELISNRVRPNGKAVVECPMESAGRLRAVLWTSNGDHVVDLVDEDRDAGVYTLEWDGRNKDGKKVAPGVYIMRLENNGHVEQKKILVQG